MVPVVEEWRFAAVVTVLAKGLMVEVGQRQLCWHALVQKVEVALRHPWCDGVGQR